MGTYMEIQAFKTVNGEADEIEHDVQWYSYDTMAWLCDVRNYARVKPLPHQHLDWRQVREILYGKRDEDKVAFGYFSDDDHEYDPNDSYYRVEMSDILAADLDEVFEYRRNNGNTLPAGQGKMMTMQEYLECELPGIAKLKELGAEFLLLRFH